MGQAVSRSLATFVRSSAFRLPSVKFTAVFSHNMIDGRALSLHVARKTIKSWPRIGYVVTSRARRDL